MDAVELKHWLQIILFDASCISGGNRSNKIYSHRVQITCFVFLLFSVQVNSKTRFNSTRWT